MNDPISIESLFSIAPWMIWSFVALCGLIYFISSYLFEILAQKMDCPRWMAWVPFASSYLMFKLVGWEKWFKLFVGAYAFALVSFLLGPLAFLGMLVMIPTVIAGIIFALMYWPKLSMERDLSAGFGLVIVLPQFIVPVIEWFAPSLAIWASLLATAAGFAAFLMIVFHDGGPRSAPHPIGYVLTGVGCLLIGVLVHTLPAKLMEDPEFQMQMQTFAAQLQESSQEGSDFEFELAANEESSELSADELLSRLASWKGTENVPTLESGKWQAAGNSSPASIAPDPYVLPKGCPDGALERRGAVDGGRATWCELENGSEWVRHGPSRTWRGNGSIRDEGVYYLGKRTGTWTRYSRSRSREVQAEFHDGVQHGWMHRWDEQGNFATGVFYQEGKPAQAPTGDALAVH